MVKKSKIFGLRYLERVNIDPALIGGRAFYILLTPIGHTGPYPFEITDYEDHNDWMDNPWD